MLYILIYIIQDKITHTENISEHNIDCIRWMFRVLVLFQQYESTNNMDHRTRSDATMFRISTLYQIFLPSRLIIKSR